MVGVRRGIKPFWFLVALPVAGVAGWVAWFVTRPDSDLEKADQRAGVVAAATGLVALLVAVVAVVLAERAARPGDPAAALDAATHRLVQRLRRRHDSDPASRQRSVLGSLRVRWEPLGAELTSRSSQRIAGPGGDVGTLADELNGLDPQQLVLVGEPASGKSSMAAQLAVLLSEADPARVPVLLSLSSWQPGEQSLSEWLRARLIEEHPELTRTRFGDDAPGELVAQGRILPILDGFDELPPELHETARARLVTEAATGRPFVVTMRADAYRRTVRARGQAFGRAAVVQLRPLDPRQMISALAADDIEEIRPRWEPVERRIKSGAGPLARVLSSPLMLYLARLAYDSGDRDPVELTRFRSDREIIEHLLDGYLPAVYRDRYDPRRVHRWLAVLADHVERSGQSPNLSWWRLLPLVPRARFFYVFGVGLVTNALFYAQYGWPGFIAGAVVVLLSFSATEGRVPRQPRWRQLGPVRILAATASGVAAGFACLPLIDRAFDWRLATFTAVVTGLATAVIVLLALAARLPVIVDNTRPAAVLAADRTVFLGVLTLLGVSAAVRSGMQYDPLRGVSDGLQILLLVGTLLAAGQGFGSAWLTFGLTRIGLRVRHGFPLRLMAFLEDAQARGVLRRSGPHFQFRHAALQDHLAAARR
jgi:hypothetical protein